MNLGEYIDKYRHGRAALTRAEATIAGIKYPLPTKWLKNNRLMHVDHLAMADAMGARHLVVAATRASNNTKKERKRARAALRLAPASVHVRVSVDVGVAPVRNLQYDYANSPEFLASFEWRQLRFRVLQKYGARCQCCGATPASGAVMHVDHIKPRRKFPELALDFDNLQVLCDACNHGKSNATADFRPAQGGAQSYA